MFLFDRVTELVLSNGYAYSSKLGVRFELSYTTITEEQLPICEIRILNIDYRLKSKIEIGLQGSLNIGYGDNISELVSGDIKNIELDKKTITFDLSSSSGKYEKNLSMWYNKQVREDFIVEDISNKLKFKLQGSELLKEYRQEFGHTISGQGINSIIKICKNRGLEVTTISDIVKIYNPDNKGKIGDILLRFDSGLIDVNKYMEEDNKYDYIVESLPIQYLHQGDIFKIEHEKLNGACKIIDFDINCATNWKAKYYIKLVKTK